MPWTANVASTNLSFVNQQRNVAREPGNALGVYSRSCQENIFKSEAEA